MHPFFIAHLVADFLLQPTWLVRLKERSGLGICVHALIHATVTSILVFPLLQGKILAGIFAVALLHGLIDFTKVKNYGRFSFAGGFFLDQVAHLLVIAVTARIVGGNLPFWESQPGGIVAGILVFFSFGFACHHLLQMPNYPHDKKHAVLMRLALITAAFLIFFLPATLLAVSGCGEL